jgi:hypothetical protein
MSSVSDTALAVIVAAGALIVLCLGILVARSIA